MDNAIWSKIITELQEIGYKGHIALNLYNEPLLDVSLQDKIKEIKTKLPDTFVKFNSNGDYLDKKRLSDLAEAGLDWLLVTCHDAYLKDGEHYAENNVREFISKIGLDDYIDSFTSSLNNVTVTFKSLGLNLLVTANNWNITGNYRGGAVEKLKQKVVRKNPCVDPFRSIQIAYDGAFKPCCDAYFSELGDGENVKNISIVDHYFSEYMIDLRRSLLQFGEDKPAECQYCNRGDNSMPESMEKRKAILDKANV